MKRKTTYTTVPLKQPAATPVATPRPNLFRAALLSARAKKAWETRRKAAADAKAKAEVKTILADNAKFGQLTKAQQRVAIAKDVIAALKAQRLFARTGTWARIGRDCPVSLEKLSVGTELQGVFNQPNVSCDACALGACFVSAVKLGNDCKLTADARDNGEFNFYLPSDGGGDQTGMSRTLSRYFDEEQLSLIECAFEVGEGALGKPYDKFPDDSDIVDRAAEFGEGFDYDHDRMEAIMNNIINNNGEFKP